MHLCRTCVCCCSVARLCLTLCDAMDCSMTGSSVLHYILLLLLSHFSRVQLCAHRRQPTRLPCPWDSPGKNTGGVAISFSNAGKRKVKVKSLSRARLLSDPMDCSLPGSSIHGIFQARVLEWVAIAFSDYILEFAQIHIH